MNHCLRGAQCELLRAGIRADEPNPPDVIDEAHDEVPQDGTEAVQALAADAQGQARRWYAGCVGRIGHKSISPVQLHGVK